MSLYRCMVEEVKLKKKSLSGDKGWSHHLVFVMVQEPYIQRPLEEGPFDLTIRGMGSEFRYALRKVLGT